MLRRLAVLGVVLLGLSGVVPAVVACALPMQGHTQDMDCCPADQPCEPSGAPAAVAPVGAPCCAAEPAPARTVVVASSQNDRRFDDSPAPDLSFAAASDVPRPRAATITAIGPIAALHPKTDQQQIYLRTGRLRL